MNLAKNITIIPARKIVGTQKITEKAQKVRVAAYARVSTDFEEQESSYDVQVEHYTTYINSNPEWELVEIYADDGISATSTTKRELCIIAGGNTTISGYAKLLFFACYILNFIDFCNLLHGSSPPFVSVYTSL